MNMYHFKTTNKMNNYLKLILISLTIISCNSVSKDIVIEKGYACEAHFNYPEPIQSDFDIVSESHEMQLKNNSETKVYKVVVKIINKGKVELKKYIIEPTDLIKLGCDKDYDVTLIHGAGEAKGHAYVSNISNYNIIYIIESTEVLREY